MNQPNTIFTENQKKSEPKNILLEAKNGKPAKFYEYKMKNVMLTATRK
jgi:hypothetical protein